jgi:hypothetical protein
MPYKDPAKRKQYNKEYRKKNSEPLKKYDRDRYKKEERKYSKKVSDFKKLFWTPEMYEQSRIQQNDRCDICKKLPTARKLSADHDHRTNRPRALLCGKCNTILGLACDVPEVLEAAASYLRKWSSV